MIVPLGVSLTAKFPDVRLVIERAVNTRAVLPRVIESVTSFHPVSAFVLPCDTYTTASAISVALSASLERVGTHETFTTYIPFSLPVL